MNAKAHLLGVAGMAMLLLAACSKEEGQPARSNDDLITFNTSVSRAENTTTQTLKSIQVYADADGAPMFIDGDVATKADNGFFTFATPQYWPTGINTVRFWAFGPTDIAGLTPKITADNQYFDYYTPASGTDNPGAKHRDLVVAYSSVDRNSATGTNVKLDFHHAMSRILVKAKSGSMDNTRLITIKGAWIVNPKASGQLAFDEAATTTSQAKWTTKDDVAIYGLQLSEPNDLTPTSTTTLIGGSDNSDLLLIPQQTAKWNMAANGETDNAATGAYILLLCRIEFKHPGEFHTSGGTTPGAIFTPTFSEGTPEKDKYHLHQVFPDTDNYSKEEFGYTCVPIDINWKPGYKYEYTLTFCGQNSGAGVYPPTPLDPSLPDGEPAPDGKKPGDLVLNDPIQFEVSVSGWSDGTPDQDGDVNMN